MNDECTSVEFTPTVPEIIDKLRSLGSPRQIADFLASQGVVGERLVAGACPLANYLHREAHEPVSVGALSIGVGWPPIAQPDTYIIGTALQGFVREFDAGRYPELEAGVIT
jgi:hypothetical protein